MHNSIETIKYDEGVPSVLLTDSFTKQFTLLQFLYRNHAIHHLQKGDTKYNFNIILPFFDYIFFTKKYGACYDNTEYCRKTDEYRCAQKIKGCVKYE
jgi:sterol desaturase/sphingolipid hydroxylase (fatty acid hydroxylase superfamily)